MIDDRRRPVSIDCANGTNTTCWFDLLTGDQLEGTCITWNQTNHGGWTENWPALGVGIKRFEDTTLDPRMDWQSCGSEPEPVQAKTSGASAVGASLAALLAIALMLWAEYTTYST